jgi:hypothetical protein
MGIYLAKLLIFEFKNSFMDFVQYFGKFIINFYFLKLIR